MAGGDVVGCNVAEDAAQSLVSSTSRVCPMTTANSHSNGSPRPSGGSVDWLRARAMPANQDLGFAARKLGQISRSLICLTGHTRADPSTPDRCGDPFPLLINHSPRLPHGYTWAVRAAFSRLLWRARPPTSAGRDRVRTDEYLGLPSASSVPEAEPKRPASIRGDGQPEVPLASAKIRSAVMMRRSLSVRPSAHPAGGPDQRSPMRPHQAPNVHNLNLALDERWRMQ